jgi:septum formation protein
VKFLIGEKMELILASNSPRRKELLQKAGFKFVINPSDYEEKSFSSNPELVATTFAEGKAESVFNKVIDKEKAVVLGADTVVYLDGKIYGKAQNKEQAKSMLKSLSGKAHSVVTGYCIITLKEKIIGKVTSKVIFNELSDTTIDEYVNSGLYVGKAGSYGIQDDFPLVKECVGSLDNVIGLPTEEIVPKLRAILTKNSQ